MMFWRPGTQLFSLVDTVLYRGLENMSAIIRNNKEERVLEFA
jgi:hypothetical protein